MAEFQVLYPDSAAVYELSATPTTKSTLNSAGLVVEDVAYRSTVSKQTLVLESLGGMGGHSHTLSSNSTGFTISDSLSITRAPDGDYPGFQALFNAENFVVNNQTSNALSSLASAGVSIYNGAFTGSNMTTFENVIITAPSGAVATLDTAKVKIDDATNFASLASTALTFSLDAAMSPAVSIGSSDGLSLQSGPLEPSELWDTATHSAGTSGQFLTTTGAGTEWVTYTPSTPNLASVLGVATAGNADNQPISNLASIAFAASAVGQTPLSITGAPSSAPSSVADVLSVNYAVDTTSGRTFANSYVEIKVNGTSYWVQLFSAPPV